MMTHLGKNLYTPELLLEHLLQELHSMRHLLKSQMSQDQYSHHMYHRKLRNHMYYLHNHLDSSHQRQTHKLRCCLHYHTSHHQGNLRSPHRYTRCLKRHRHIHLDSLQLHHHHIHPHNHGYLRNRNHLGLNYYLSIQMGQMRYKY